MKVTAIALAAALTVPAFAYSEREPTPTSWKWIGQGIAFVGGVIGGINGAIDLWNKVNPPAPAAKPGDQFYCPPTQCGFGPVGSQLSTTGFEAVTAFAMSLGKAWNPGDMLTVCNGFECVTVQWTGGMFIAMGPVHKDPRAGYANSPRNSGGGGEGSAGSSYTPSSRVWHPAVVYNPGSHLRVGTVTIIQHNTGGGGGGSGRFPGSYETD